MSLNGEKTVVGIFQIQAHVDTRVVSQEFSCLLPQPHFFSPYNLPDFPFSQIDPVLMDLAEEEKTKSNDHANE